MIFLFIVALTALFTVLAIVRLRAKECFKCALISTGVLFGVLFISNVLYTGYLNIDAPSSDRRAAISLAVCNPIENASVIPEGISCAPILTAYGVELTISSGRVLSDEEIEKFIRRVQRLKPLITSGRIQVSFKHYQTKSVTSGLTKEGVPVRSTQYEFDTYKIVSL